MATTWKKVKPGRIEKGEYAIVTLKRHSDRKEVFTLYKNGDIVDFFDTEKEARDSIKETASKKKAKKKNSY